MAANQFSMTLIGADELVKRLKALPPEISGKNGGPVRRSLAKAANMIKEAAIAKAPVRSGNLQEHIAILRDRAPQRAGANERYMVGIRGGTRTTYANSAKNRRKGLVGKTYEKQGSAFYARFVELGTSKMRPQPFLRPAFNENASDAINLFLVELDKDIQRIAKRLARNSP